MRPQKRLVDIQTDEISFVDKAANNRTFTVIKRAIKERDEGGGDMSVADKYNETAKLKEFDDRMKNFQKQFDDMAISLESVEKVTKDGVKVDTSDVEKTFEDKIKAINESFEVEKEVIKGDYSDLSGKIDQLTDTVEKMAHSFADMRKSMPVRKGISAPANKDYGENKLAQVGEILKSLANPNVKKALLGGKGIDIKDAITTLVEAASESSQ